jgi:Fe-S-cluster-containing dehydrogenase component
LRWSSTPDPSIGDGRDANNGWLQELPKPITQLVWDNGALISMKDAQAWGVQIGDLLDVTVSGEKLSIPALPQPGQPEGVIAIYLGHGRTKAGTIASVVVENGDEIYRSGFNAYPLRKSGGMGFAAATVAKGSGNYKLETTQMHHSMEGRDIIRSATLAEFMTNPSMEPDKQELLSPSEQKNEGIAKGNEQSRREEPEVNLYQDKIFDTNLPQWGMAIDLNHCIGCNACVTSCQAENNIPIVGKKQVERGREMHWLRIDRYYGPNYDKNDFDQPGFEFQPMMCQHCEMAPCEPVCPVGATMHSHEGLNQMVYNRCVGTRYCSNNCPYKVRRFNFLNYTDNQPQFMNLNTTLDGMVGRGTTSSPKKEGIQLLKMLENPDVTVRGRGVMEKCTYCVQRINDARIEAKKENREIADGDIVTACQQACPTKTIVFGNIADPDSAVSKIKREQRAYRVLEDVNTRPRTSYLGRVRNPNPAIKSEVGA